MEDTSYNHRQSSSKEQAISGFSLGIIKEFKPPKPENKILKHALAFVSAMTMSVALVCILFRLFEVSFWLSCASLAFHLYYLSLISMVSNFGKSMIYIAINITLIFFLYPLAIS